VKKSRALSTPAEVDENANEEQVENSVDASENEGPAPSPQPSPPGESKVCQISQGSGDVSRRNRQSTPQAGIDITTAPNDSAPSELQTQTVTTSTIPTPEIQNKSGAMKVPVTEEVDPSIPIAEAALAASSESLSAPPIATVPPAIEDDNTTTSTIPISQPAATPPRDLDNPPSKELKGDDAGSDSSTKNIKQPTTPPHSEVDGATKRPREDEDGDVDPNPREPKRASPPPEKDIDTKDRPAKKKNGSEVHTPSAPTSPRAKSGSVFVSHSPSDFLDLPELTRTQGGGGFLAYAAVTSPFAAVRGPNIFGASSASSATTGSSTTTTTTMTSTPISNATPILTTAPSALGSPPRTVPSSPVQRAASPTPAKRTGFEAFASAASPLVSAAARARSPVRRSGSPGPGTGARSNPFAIYATGGTQSLFGAAGAPAAKRARGDSESTAPGECGGESSSWREGSIGPEKTFGERLRAGSGSGGDEEDEPDGGSGVLGENVASAKWAEQEGKFSRSASLLPSSLNVDFYFFLVLTGEEEDETIHSVRGKLFVLSEQNQWKERGTGLLRLNRRRVDHSGARLGMFRFNLR
jgi:Ran-binding protein 3